MKLKLSALDVFYKALLITAIPIVLAFGIPSFLWIGDSYAEWGFIGVYAFVFIYTIVSIVITIIFIIKQRKRVAAGIITGTFIGIALGIGLICLFDCLRR